MRDSMFAAATYFRAADFFLHGNENGPRITSLWVNQTACFDKGISLLLIPELRRMLKGDGFAIPMIFYVAASASAKAPKQNIVLVNSYNSSQEEMLHVSGFAALERGWNVITYKGPGQLTVRRGQGLGFIIEWEKIISPVLDHLATLPELDMARASSLGFSMRAWLAVRAAVFEPRIRAIIAIDGNFLLVSLTARVSAPAGSSLRCR